MSSSYIYAPRRRIPGGVYLARLTVSFESGGYTLENSDVVYFQIEEVAMIANIKGEFMTYIHF